MPLHKDPFDRILVAQARTEAMLLLTADATVAALSWRVMVKGMDFVDTLVLASPKGRGDPGCESTARIAALRSQ